MSKTLVHLNRLALVLIGIGFLSVDAGAAVTREQGSHVRPAPTHAKKPTPPRRATRSRTRRLSPQARARAAREIADAQIPKFKLDANGDLVPDLRVAAAIIYDPENHQVLWEENSQDKRSIASITKVMTAIVFMESNPDLSQEVKIQRTDVRGASTTFLRLNDRVKVDDLLHLLLIPSDNAAARALARISPAGSEGFVARMNAKAADLGLESTSYADPSGLDPNNVSSAYDMARLITYASEDERISPIMRLPEYSFRPVNRQLITVRSTNQLVRAGDVDVRGGKTGFIGKAGYCLAMLLRLPQGGPPIAVVVLGATSNFGRFIETRHLLDWLSTKAQLFSLVSPAIAASPR